jgi:hypothetical protein
MQMEEERLHNPPMNQRHGNDTYNRYVITYSLSFLALI